MIRPVGDMTVPVMLHLSEDMLPQGENIEKLAFIASLPGAVGQIDVLPDVHFKAKNFVPTGVILQLQEQVSPMLVSPSNDSLILGKTNLNKTDIDNGTLDRVFAELKQRIAMFRRSEPIVDAYSIMQIMRFGAPSVCRNWGFDDDALERLDNGGQLFGAGREPSEADILRAFPDPGVRPRKLPDFVPWSDFITAGQHCLGVLDGGGHFLELTVVDEIMDAGIAEGLELAPGQIFVAAHIGSADVGLIAHKHFLPDDSNSIVTHNIEEDVAKRFLVAQRAAGNFAFANRLFILAQTRDALSAVLESNVEMAVFSDAPHDMLDEVEFDQKTSYLHRKGVVLTPPAAAFPKGHPFSRCGRPFFFPSSLGEDAYILTRPYGNPGKYGVCSHGVGRSMSREEAMAAFSDDDLERQLKESKIRLYRYGHDGFSAQAPAAHKEANKILDLLRGFGLGQQVARLSPLASLKA